MNMKKLLSCMISLVLIAAMVLTATSCATADSGDGSGTSAPASDPSGETEKQGVTITVEVTLPEDEKKTFTITTEGTTLRAALEEENLIEGEEGTFGLYVKKVCGVLADYDENGAYWAFSKNGEYLMSGVDTTEIADGEHYEITYTK